MEDKVSKLCAAFGSLALGWNPERLGQRIDDIRRYYRSNSDIVPLSKRREIARWAQKGLAIFEGLRNPDSASLCGLDPAFENTLRDLAAQPGDGRSLKGSLAAMIVRLHIEAHAKPEYSAPLISFATAIYDFLEMPMRERPANDTLKAEFTKLKAEFMADKTRVLVRSRLDPTITIFGPRIWPEDHS